MSRALLALISLLWLATAHGAVTLDGLPTIAGGSGDFGDLSFTHTVGAGTNLLVVCTSTTTGTTSNDISGITFAGQALTRLAFIDQSNTAHAELWYRLAPITGAQTVAVDAASDPWIIAVAVNVTGALQQAPTGATASSIGSTSASVNVSGTAEGELLLDCLSAYPSEPLTATPGSGQTSHWHTQHDSAVFSAGSTKAGAATSTTMSWSLNDIFTWAQAAMRIAPAVAPPSATRRRIRNLW